MKILLANLPWQKGRCWGVRAGSRWPHIKTAQEKDYLPFPFFLAYAAALLKREGFEVALIDSLAEELPDGAFLKRVAKENPDLLVAETSTPSLSNDIAILKKLPKGLPVALCGPEASIREPDFLTRNPVIQYVFVGEYEYTLLELVQALDSKKNFSGINGLIYRNHGDAMVNPARSLLEDLDMLPWPLRDGLPMERYNDAPGGIPSPSVQMWSSRGCPYQCMFCIWPQLMYRTNRYRIRNIRKVIDEMEYLVKHMGFRSVYFDDDTTNIGKLRMVEFAEEIKRRGLKVPWAMMARADLMDEALLENLRSAGLFAIKYGVESADQRLVDNICKSMDLRKAERMIRFTKSIGIKTHLTFSFGLPGESLETIQKTIEFAKALDPDSLQFSIATAFPGTSYFQTLEEKGHIVSRVFSDYDGNFKSMLRTDALNPKDLQDAKCRAEREWQEHVWTTRPHPVTLRDYFKKIAGSLKIHGLGITILKGFDFFWSRIKVSQRKSGGSFWKFLVKFKTPCADFWCSWKVKFRKIQRASLNLLGVYHGSHAFKGPDCVQIDLTNNCNNNCVSCWCNSPLLKEKVYRGSRKYKTLPVQLVMSLIDELAGMGTSELYFSGGGEPFMHPGILPVIAYAKAKGMHCSINTNFTLVNEETSERLIGMSLDALTISIWAGTAKTYALTHPNKDEAGFYRIKNVLKNLNKLKKNGHPFVKIYNVILNLNCHELEKMVEFAEETGSEAVEFAVVDTIPGATDQLVLSREERQAVLEQCDRIRKKGSKVQIQNLEHFRRRLSDASADSAQYDSGYLGAFPCYVGWVFSRIMPDGDVNFCLKAHRIPVGNLYRNSFREIWNSQKQRGFRQKALKFDKGDSFFQLIGNDKNCSMGCYKSCDNIGHNAGIAKIVASLNPPQRKIFETVGRITKLCKKIDGKIS